MTERTDELLAQILELQRRQLTVQEAGLENQRVVLERQRRAMRALPLLLGLWILFLYGPYLFQLVRYYMQR